MLLQTKETNAPAHFSFSFKVGVYMPLLSPFVIPVGLTLFLVLRTKILGSKAKENKSKVD